VESNSRNIHWLFGGKTWSGLKIFENKELHLVDLSVEIHGEERGEHLPDQRYVKGKEKESLQDLHIECSWPGPVQK
jgi:hypothetical protein